MRLKWKCPLLLVAPLLLVKQENTNTINSIQELDFDRSFCMAAMVINFLKLHWYESLPNWISEIILSKAGSSHYYNNLQMFKLVNR